MTKYRAQPVTIDGIRFHSKAEGNHYAVLKLRERTGEISGLELQPAFPILINGKKVCTYKADFAYIENGARKVIDIKGARTPVYVLKKKLVEASYPGVVITEVAA